MPVVIRLFGYKIFFWTSEGKPLEPIHVHVAERPQENATKIWILSSGKTKIVNNNSKITPGDLKRICKTIETFHQDIEKEWEKNFGQVKYYNKVNMLTRYLPNILP